MIKSIIEWFKALSAPPNVYRKHAASWRYKVDIGGKCLVRNIRIARNIQNWGYTQGKKFSYKKHGNQYIVTRKA